MNYRMPIFRTATFWSGANLRIESQTVSETLRYLMLAPVLFAMTIVVAVALSWWANPSDQASVMRLGNGLCANVLIWGG